MKNSQQKLLFEMQTKLIFSFLFSQYMFWKIIFYQKCCGLIVLLMDREIKFLNHQDYKPKPRKITLLKS